MGIAHPRGEQGKPRGRTFSFICRKVLVGSIKRCSKEPCCLCHQLRALLVALTKRRTVSRKSPCLVGLNPTWVVCRLHVRLSLPLPVPSSSSCPLVPPLFLNAAAEFCACAKDAGQRKLTGRPWAKRDHLVLPVTVWHPVFPCLGTFAQDGMFSCPVPTHLPSTYACAASTLLLPPPCQSLPACAVLDLHSSNLKINAQYSCRHMNTHKLICLSSAFERVGLQLPSAHSVPPRLPIDKYPATAGKVRCKPKLYCKPAAPRRVAWPLLLPKSLFLPPDSLRNAPLPH